LKKSNVVNAVEEIEEITVSVDESELNDCLYALIENT